MAAQLNHTIVWCSDKMASSAFLARILGRPAPRPFHHFMVVDLDNDVSLDFMQKSPAPGSSGGRTSGDWAISRQHYAFLIGEEDFDPILARIRSEGVNHWADPARTKPGEINRHYGGRGVYFEDPDGHLLEVITRPYGSE